MVSLGDYFALSIVVILCVFYFEDRNFMIRDNRYFVISLVATAASALLDMLSCSLMEEPAASLWLKTAVTDMSFLSNLVVTTSFGFFLLDKLTVHAISSRCQRVGRVLLTLLLSFYGVIAFTNRGTGWLFSFAENGAYIRGPLNKLGYFITTLQMAVVLMCFFKNSATVSRSMQRAILQSFPVTLACFVIQHQYPEVMMNSLIMAMGALILFVNFQSHPQGTHGITKLSDRSRFFQDVEYMIRGGKQIQVLFLGLRDMGVINQKYGFRIGDEVLFQFAVGLENRVGAGSLYHMNGVEFALVFQGLRELDIQSCRDRILSYLEEGILFGGGRVFPGHFMVEYQSDGRETDVSELYEKLQYTANLAKRSGRDYLIYTDEIGREMVRRRYLLERLKDISARSGYRVVYQPIRNLAHPEARSAEALLRLTEKDGSAISPGELIPVAEQNGMVDRVNWFVMEEVCRFLSSHPELDNLSVSVNLSMVQSSDRSFRKKLNALTEKYGIRHDRLCLEFTERVLPQEVSGCKRFMGELNQEGYRFYLDDFGSGFSNFNIIMALPFEGVKLDICMVKDTDREEISHGMVRTVTGLFHQMGLSVTAEGAEEESQVAALREQGVDRIQGYYFSRPLEPEQLVEYYRKHP